MKDKVLNTSRKIWTALSEIDDKTLRNLIHKNAKFVHMGMTVDRDGEIEAYTSKKLQPGRLEILKQDVQAFDNTYIVYTDANVGAVVHGKEVMHHFLVTEVYVIQSEEPLLVSFVFTNLTY